MKRYFVGYMLLCALMLAFVCLAVHEARGASSREYLLWQAWNSLGQKNPQDQARIRHFIDAKGKEQELLDQAKKKIAQQNALRKHLRAQFESNKNRLSMLNSELKTREGQLGLLFGYATGSAKYFNESLHNSIVSNQYPNLGIGAS
ncbi:MAG: hypothetical protein ACRES9_04475, partial [Gammaproteobacteria bacterium]